MAVVMHDLDHFVSQSRYQVKHQYSDLIEAELRGVCLNLNSLHL